MKLKIFSLAAGVALLLAACSNLQDGAGTQSSGASGGQAGAGGSGGTAGGAWAVQTVGGTIGASGIFPEGFFGDADGGESNAGDTAEGADGISKTLLPPSSLIGTTVGITYTVTAKHAGQEDIEATVTKSGSSVSYSVTLPFSSESDEWTLYVYGRQSSSPNTILLGAVGQIAYGESSKDFTVTYVSNPAISDAKGSVSLAIPIDSASGIKSAVISCGPVGGSSAAEHTVNVESDKITTDFSDLDPGAYEVRIVFFDADDGGGNALYAINEVANVYANWSASMPYGNAEYISSSGFKTISSEMVAAAKSVSDGGIWLGGTGLMGAAANDSNSGTKFKPVATLQRAFAIANALAAIDSSKTYNIKIQGDVFAGTSANKTATLSGDAKVLLEGTSTSSSSYKSIKGSSGTYKIDTSSSSLTCRYLIFDYLGGFTVAGGETTMNYCKVQNGQSADAGTAGGITVAGGASFNSTASLTITGCANTAASGGGGGIYCGGTLSLKGTTIQKCKATGTSANGGGIYVDGSGATVTLDGCVIGETSSSTASSTSLCSNYAASNGGGIYIASSSATGVTLKNSTNVSYNYAANGGGIYANDGKLSMASTTVQRNGTETKGCGAGIYLYKTALTFADAACAVSKNTANPATYSSANGGGLYISASVTGAMTIKGTFNGNTAYNGGGIYNASTKSVTLDSTCAIGASGAGNIAKNGSGVYNNATSSLIVNGATIQYNGDSTASKGGGIYNNKGSLYVYGSTSISHNTVTGYGGGIYNYSTGTLKLGYDASGIATAWTGSIAANEVASDSDSSGGGGICSEGSFDMASGTIGGSSAALGNKAVKGAGLRISGGSSSISGGTIQCNEATKEGGGIWTAGNLTVSATISNNSAAEKGGGIYNSGKVTVSAATFNANAADKGSGIYYKGITGMGTTLTLSGNCKIGTSSTDRLGIHLENAVSPIALSSFSKTNGKVEITPDVGGGCVIGTNLISSGVTSATVLGYFTLPESMSDVYRLLQNSAAAKLDLQPVSQITVAGGTVSENISQNGAGAFKNAASTPVTVRSIKMAQYEVNYELWYAVYQWAIHRATNTYTFGSCGKEGDNAAADDVIGGITESVPPTTEIVLGEGRGGQRPVNYISWRDAVVWCNAYSEYMGLTPVYYTNSTYATPMRSCNDTDAYSSTLGGQDCPYIKAGTNGNTDMANCNTNGARLPTDAEWEFAARGGNPSAAAFKYNYTVKSSRDDLPLVAWFKDNSDVKMHVVGQKTPNALNLYDMLGNTTEWCHDLTLNSSGKEVRRERGGNSSASENTSSTSQQNCNVSYQGTSNCYRTGARCGFRFVQNN